MLTVEAESVLESFDELSAEDQRDLALEIWRRARGWSSEPLTDEDLARMADDLFVALDHEEEARHGNAQAG